MTYKSTCILTDSPVDESHGRVAGMVFSSSTDNYCGPEYEVVSGEYESGELKRAVATVDILFEDYVYGNLRLLSSEQVGSVKNGMYALYYNTDGTLYNNSYTFTNQENWAKYTKYKLNTWYNFRVELDLEDQTFSMWINGDEITADTKIITNAKTDMIDFLHMRVNLYKSSAGEDAKNIYIDNFGYYIPMSYVYTKPVIELTPGSSKLSVTAAAPGEDKATLVAALYEDDVLTKVSVQDTEQFDGIAIADYICDFAKGKKYKFFLMEDAECLRPLCKAKEYYSFTYMDYELLKDKWREFLVGGEVDLTSEPIAARVTAIYNNAKNLPGTMNRSADATSLWGAAYTASSHLGTEYSKIYRMALAYGTKGQALYQDEDLYNDIIYALDWMYENRYGQAEIDGTGWRSVRAYNWWDWFVSAPGYIMETLMILHEEVTDEQIDKYFSLYTYLKTIMRTDLSLDSNVNSWAYNAYGAAVLQKDEATIRTMTEAYDVLFVITTSGTGMYEDFSYIKHNMMAYTGMYGTGALLDRVVKVMSITGNTHYAIPQVKTHMYENWIFNAFEPLMYNAGIMSMMRGRGVDGGNEYGDGLTVLESILNMIDVVSDEDAFKFKMLIKRHFKGDRLTYAYNNLTLPHIIKLESIVNDNSLPEPEPYELTKVYYHMDRAVQHKENYTFGLAMSSERVANYESINNVNKNGWYTGDGMTYLYTAPDQYNANYFKYADPYKRPGTTVDSQERQEISIAYGHEYFSGKDFVGGTTMDDSYGVVAMDLESFHNDVETNLEDKGYGIGQPLHDCDLTAKKSWYMFDEEIVCLGADVNATADYDVFTTVENRMITSEKLSVNGIDVAYGTSGSTTEPEWAHIDGTGGYYFPEGGNLSYRQIKNTKNFFEMWLSHGSKPTGGSYSYALLPGKTAAQTEAYIANPKFEILSNTSAVQAVYQKELDITGYTFWSAGSFDGITISAPATVMKKNTADGMELTFSDPTHKLDDITITLDGEYTPAEYDEQLNVTVSHGKTVISGDLSAVTGKTLKVKLTK
ncbi:MAG: polysaccharide lyase 8 family protein [Clostridia bacterium]|nr:polysaccharide lyase 8 family protein [Clostridia bacterium]